MGNTGSANVQLVPDMDNTVSVSLPLCYNARGLLAAPVSLRAASGLT